MVLLAAGAENRPAGPLPTSALSRSRAGLGAAVESSLLRSFPPAARERLLADATTVQVAAGSVLWQPGEEPSFGIVLSGLLHVFIPVADGRQVTVRYARAGELIGIMHVVGAPIGGGVQALAESRILLLNVRVFQELARAEPEVAWATVQELARRHRHGAWDLAGNTLGSVRERLARHLLDVAQPEGDQLVARVSQQELADAVGTAREVVARTLRSLRAERVVLTGRRSVVIRRPRQLRRIASVTNVTHDLDEGR